SRPRPRNWRQPFVAMSSNPMNRTRPGVCTYPRSRWHLQTTKAICTSTRKVCRSIGMTGVSISCPTCFAAKPIATSSRRNIWKRWPAAKRNRIPSNRQSKRA
ncbi:uncharacterized protein METZ01_LOCUS292641, partial [marine metagenome]